MTVFVQAVVSTDRKPDLPTAGRDQPPARDPTRFRAGDGRLIRLRR
jgi:hypothetical protein